ncbi:MAG: hypothetical protein IPF68_19715 [Bacteroidales bacterium]|nr:hypothetical protein [Bacteroidales bacterium]
MVAQEPSGNSASGSSTFEADAWHLCIEVDHQQRHLYPSTADVTVNYYESTVTSDAGVAQNLCNVTTTTLAGNDPTPGTGLWTLVSGPNTPAITSPTAYNSTVTSMVPGVYVFRWTISSGTCPTSESTVTITNYATPTTSTTGADQTICGLTSTSLGGNTPVNGTGAWSQTSGPGTTTFSASGTGSSTATATLYGTYTYTWTISNGVCAPSTSEMEVTYYQTPTSKPLAELRTCAELLRVEPLVATPRL